jgi:hypothetical protein
MCPGREEVDNPILLTKSVNTDYEQEFKEQLRRNDAGWYEAKLPWKGNHPPLPTNEAGS